MSDISLIYVTYPSKSEAQEVFQALLEARLVACANIFPAHEALYRWDGQVENAQEVGVLYKTLSNHFAEIESKIKSLHSYDVPCIVSWSVGRGSPDFLQWVSGEVL